MTSYIQEWSKVSQLRHHEGSQNSFSGGNVSQRVLLTSPVVVLVEIVEVFLRGIQRHSDVVQGVADECTGHGPRTNPQPELFLHR